jgi:UDP-N-acetylmuramyl pentapeptide phosphotransferase/UDP-N-acetylglucosamine-1-phosphate transferase
LDNWFRIYAWFLLVVTALPAFARLVRPRELAQIMLFRYQNPKRRKRARLGGAVFLALALLATPVLLHSPLHQQRWLLMALLVGAVAAVEFLINSRTLGEDELAHQNRIFGGVYASIAIAVALLLATR